MSLATTPFVLPFLSFKLNHWYIDEAEKTGLVYPARYDSVTAMAFASFFILCIHSLITKITSLQQQMPIGCFMQMPCFFYNSNFSIWAGLGSGQGQISKLS
jgi:hypothetical protein